MTDTVAAAATPTTPTAAATPAPSGQPVNGGQEPRDLLAGDKPTTGALPQASNLLGDTPQGPTGATDPAQAGATGATGATSAAGATGAAEPVKFKPEDYKITAPEGLDAKDPAIGAFVAAAAEHGVAPEAAQKLIDAAGPEIVKAMTQPYQAWKDLQENWQTQVRNDPEIGGAKFESTVLPTIVKAMDRYGDPGLREALATTGAGNNPAIIRTLYKLSKMVTEGNPVIGNPAATGKSIAEKMYDHPTSRAQRA